MKKRILAISAGQTEYKKQTNAVKGHIRYLNYGLLGLATMIRDVLGLDVVMAQGDGRSPEDFLAWLEECGVRVGECERILLSVPSYYSVSWCVSLCELMHTRYGRCVSVGGRWVVDDDPDWIRRKLVYVDEIVVGFGEHPLAQLLCPERAHLVREGRTQCFEHLDYSIMLGYEHYQPSIEVSRGCGSGCAFCADKANKRLQNIAVDNVMRELDYLDSVYSDYTYYLEAPHFCFSPSWVDEFVKRVREREVMHPWRCTTRVESVPLGKIGELASSGLKILDIGLESASPEQLLRMGKTRDPERYLERAHAVLEECAREGVWVKLNILLFAGENAETVRQTLTWLRERRHLIKGVAVSTLVYYKGAGSLDDLVALGARVPEGADLGGSGYIDLDLSDEMSVDTARVAALNICREMMSARDYYDIKSVSYFERGYTYRDFLADVAASDPESLPFATDRDD